MEEINIQDEASSVETEAQPMPREEG